VRITSAQVFVRHAGVSATATRASEEKAIYHGPLPDILAYLQNETELTRSTIVRVLKEPTSTFPTIRKWNASSRGNSTRAMTSSCS
jgi:hypothetical protein